MKVAFISANLGSFDLNVQEQHVEQILPVGVTLDFFYFTDKELLPRPLAMTSRLRAKIPKMLGWELVPGYDYYIWADAVITLDNPHAVTWLLKECKGVDIALLRHHDGDFNRINLKEELKFMIDHMNGIPGKEFIQDYLKRRYDGEQMIQQVETYLSDPSFKDTELYSGGLFIYRNTSKVKSMLKEWFYHNCIYTLQDQLSLPYVLSKSGCQVNKIEVDIMDNIYTHYFFRNGSKLGLWDEVYKSASPFPSSAIEGIINYSHTESYHKAADFLEDCKLVEDWGTGLGGFKIYRPDAIGVDGSNTPHANVKADLVYYRSLCDGIMLRHVLDHNLEWKTILLNALKSSRKKIVIIFFIPLSNDKTIEEKHGTQENKRYGVNVPNLSISKQEFENTITKNNFSFTTEKLNNQTAYGEETIYYITKNEIKD